MNTPGDDDLSSGANARNATSDSSLDGDMDAVIIACATAAQDCIGATDGTHVNCIVPASEALWFRNRKGALEDPTSTFLMPPPGKYYLVDSRYSNNSGFLALYPSTRYHLPEFRRGGEIISPKELFNRRHSGLRSTVEEHLVHGRKCGQCCTKCLGF